MNIIPLKLKGSDHRGTTCEYYHERLGGHLILYRKAGTVSGRHYHKGTSLTKNPEILMVLHGTCTLNWVNLPGNAMQTATVTGPTRLEIPPFTWHEIVTITDCVFMELNSIAEHEADTFYDADV